MADKNWDVFFNEFWRDYLLDPASAAAGVPVVGVCPIRAAQETEAAKNRPVMVIASEREEVPNEEVWQGRMRVGLRLLEDAAEGTAVVTAEGWLQKVRQRVADVAAVQAYIATLTGEAAEGWQPARLHVPTGAFTRDREDEAAKLELSFDFTWIVVVAAR